MLNTSAPPFFILQQILLRYIACYVETLGQLFSLKDFFHYLKILCLYCKAIKMKVHSGVASKAKQWPPNTRKVNGICRFILYLQTVTNGVEYTF